MEPEKEKPAQGRSREGFVKSLISGSLISERLILGNLGFILMLTLVGAIYIANRFHAEQTIRNIDRLQVELKELRSEAMSTTADLMYISKQTEVLRLVNLKGLGLNELKEPPYKLIVKE